MGAEANAAFQLIAGLETTVERNGPILWNTHLRGLVTLLKIRGTKCLHTPAERSIFWLLYNSVVSSDVVERQWRLNIS